MVPRPRIVGFLPKSKVGSNSVLLQVTYGISKFFDVSKVNKYSSTLQSEDFAVYLSKSIVPTSA
jgi:hypothetical protein